MPDYEYVPDVLTVDDFGAIEAEGDGDPGVPRGCIAIEVAELHAMMDVIAAAHDCIVLGDDPRDLERAYDAYTRYCEEADIPPPKTRNWRKRVLPLVRALRSLERAAAPLLARGGTGRGRKPGRGGNAGGIARRVRPGGSSRAAAPAIGATRREGSGGLQGGSAHDAPGAPIPGDPGRSAPRRTAHPGLVRSWKRVLAALAGVEKSLAEPGDGA